MSINNPLEFAITEADSWVALALCGDDYTDPATGMPMPIANMFPRDKDEAGIEEAKSLCARCPVREACLAKALKNGEQFGIWGGMTPAERTSLRRREARAQSAVRQMIQEQVTVNPGQAEVIRGRRVENVAVVDGAV